MFSSINMEEYMESELFLHFLSKTGCHKYSAWIPGDSTPSCFCSVMTLSEEIHKFSEPDCYTIVFSLLSNILIWFIQKKSHFVYLIEHFLLRVPGDPFHAVTLPKYFMHMRVKTAFFKLYKWYQIAQRITILKSIKFQ